MTNEQYNTGDIGEDPALPADLAGIERMLDAIGETDRGSMPASLGAQVAGASVHAMLHPEAVDGAAEAGAIARGAELERRLAPAGLEGRVFEASRGELATLRLAGEGVLPARRVVPVWRRAIVGRIAAAVVLAGAGVGTVIALRSVETAEPQAADVKVLAASFDSEMATFFDLLESTPSTAQNETATTTDHTITDQLLEWESL